MHPIDTPLDLQAVTFVRGGGRTDYPVVWQLGNPPGRELAKRGQEVSWTFDEAGAVTLNVTYGSATDTVTFTVVEGEAPVPTILSPEDGQSFWHYNQPDSVDGLYVPLIGHATLGGSDLPDPVSYLTWYVRSVPGSEEGWLTEWLRVANGPEWGHKFSYSGPEKHHWEVMLEATDPVTGLNGYDQVTIRVMRPPD